MSRPRNIDAAEEARICLSCPLPECAHRRPECGLVKAGALPVSPKRSGPRRRYDPAQVLALREQGYSQA